MLLLQYRTLFLTPSTEFISPEVVVSDVSTVNVIHKMLMSNLIFSCEGNIGLLQDASCLEPSSNCTFTARSCNQSAGIVGNYTVS